MSALVVGVQPPPADAANVPVFRVNAGGPLVAATDGGPDWQADTSTSPHAAHNSGSNTASWPPVAGVDASVPSSTPSEVFSTERWDPPPGGEMEWNIPVASGSAVEVRLYFANSHGPTSQAGARVFDVAIDGNTVLNDYDIFADAGHATGVMKSFTITSDGNIDIDFGHVTQNPLVNAIEVVAPDDGEPTPIGFGVSTLQGAGVNNPTSLQFGPDGRLYVAEQFGAIRVLTVERDAANDYSVTASETITAVANIPNHDDDGSVNPAVTGRLVTGLVVAGTAGNPVIYVSSSDPRIGGGPDGEDLNLDTNSSTISRLTWTGSSWQHLELVRGLPRSEENHASNGMALDEANGTLYVAQGGNTNMGAPSNNFALLPEYALSAAILSIDLDQIGNSTYDVPTLDDTPLPFGGDSGANQGMLVAGGPVQIHAPGFRNAYDVLLNSSGELYTIDNGSNAGWGNTPLSEGPAGNCTNAVREPGISEPDQLHVITQPGTYGGHPNPVRGNPSGSGFPGAVPAANPIECDYRPVAGGADGNLLTFNVSTNGLAEYTASNFGGAMTGDLLAVGFQPANSVYRIQLSANGQSVTASETLFSSLGGGALDVTTQGDSDPLPGTIWVASLFADVISVFEPNDFGGGGGPVCSGADDPGLDEDGDGFDNADEIDNGTDPCSAADFPPDWDGDFTSDLTDPDDDNDGSPDTDDPFALDPDNGASTDLPILYDWENDSPSAGGLFNLGFTGLMANGSDDYLDLFDSGAMTIGGAAGVLTVDEVSEGTALGASNSQEYGFQFGVAPQDQPFVVSTRIVGPFAGTTPAGNQQMGLFVGTGMQDDFAQIVVTADGGTGGVRFDVEQGDLLSEVSTDPVTLPGPQAIRLMLRVDPVADTVQASYIVEDSNGTAGPEIQIGSPQPIPSQWTANPLAAGIISTSFGPAPTFAATWDYLRVVEEASGESSGQMLVTRNGVLTASTFGPGSFAITNTSDSATLQSVTIDTSTALLPDIVFDPLGTAGDDTAKDITVDSDPGTGYQGHTFSSPSNGVDGADGYHTVELMFTDFDPGETFTFSADIDPTSIKGASAPGPSSSGSVSGLELIGSLVTTAFSDGTLVEADLAPIASSVSGSQVVPEAGLPAAPGVQMLGVSSTPVVVDEANQTIRVSGTPGAQVRLLRAESGLFLTGVPNGGYDIDPFEANTVVSVQQITATIGAGGTVDIPVTLTRSSDQAGINRLVAVIEGASGPGRVSNLLVVEYDPDSTPPTGDTLFRVNAGGPLVAASDGGPDWQADTSTSPHAAHNSGSNTASWPPVAGVDASVPSTTPTEVFSTERWDPAPGAEMEWNIPVASGTAIEVRLYFANSHTSTSQVGARVFDVAIDGNTVLNDYDIFADVGHATGVMKSFTITSDGNIDIDFGHVTQNPLVNAIEIVATDGGGEPTNQPPVVDTISDQSVTEGDSLTFDVSASDPDGDPLTLTDTGTPSFGDFTDNGDGTGTFTFDPAVDDAGSYDITVTATDPDSASDSETFTLDVNSDDPPPSGDVLFRVNAGGSLVAATEDGPVWEADTSTAPHPTHNTGSKTANWPAPTSVDSSVPATTPIAIFGPIRWDPGPQPDMQWDIPIPVGTDVEVRLYFANSHGPTNQVGARVFDVAIDSNTVLNDYDIVADVGANTGVMKAFTITSDGNIDIDFDHVTGSPIISAIEIVTTG